VINGDHGAGGFLVVDSRLLTCLSSIEALGPDLKLLLPRSSSRATAQLSAHCHRLLGEAIS
jgi:hypothetical protein